MAQSARGFDVGGKVVAVAILILATVCVGQPTPPASRGKGFSVSVDLKLPLTNIARGIAVLQSPRGYQLWLEGDATNKCSVSVREQYTGRGLPQAGQRGFLLWSANYYSNTPEGASKCTLTFTAQGDLQLWIVYKGKSSLNWHSNTANKGVTHIALQINPDQGNFQLLTASNKPVFSSFNVYEYLVLTGQKFWEGSLLKSPNEVYTSDDSLVVSDGGSYILAINGGDLQLLLNGPKPQVYWSLKQSLGVQTDLSNVKYAAGVQDNAKGIGLFTAANKLVYRIAVPPFVPVYGADDNFGIDFYGNLNYNLMYKGLAWEAGWQAFTDYCALPRYCGNYGICISTIQFEEPVPVCSGCPAGFVNDTSTTPQGCKRAKHVNKCNHWNYLELAGYTMAGFPTLVAKSFDACKASCSEDCSCDGFFYNFKAGNCIKVTQFLTLEKTTVNTATSVYIKV